MMSHLLAAHFALALTGAPGPRPDTALFVRLEAAWNAAHVAGDTLRLKELWADDISVTVPGMPSFTKDDMLAFWRSGRASITRYETSGLHVRVDDNTAIVTGRLLRERSFNGRTLRDDWLFTKVYRREQDHWRVVAYHASPSPES